MSPHNCSTLNKDAWTPTRVKLEERWALGRDTTLMFCVVLVSHPKQTSRYCHWAGPHVASFHILSHSPFTVIHRTAPQHINKLWYPNVYCLPKTPTMALVLNQMNTATFCIYRVTEICTRHAVRTQLYYHKWYTMYQLHVSAIILAIIRLYSTLNSNYTIYVVHFGGQDLVYSGWWYGFNLLHNQAQNI